MVGGGCGRPALTAAFVWFAAAATALAAGAPPQAVSDAPVEFDIPAQSMAAALNTWAVQANAQVFVDPAPVAHLKAPALKGSFAPRQALRALLVHSNLQVLQGADGVFVIKPRLAVAAVPKPQAPQPTPTIAAAAVVAPPAAPPRTARDGEGPWLLRLDAAYANGGGAAAVLGGEYFVTDHVAAAVAMTTPRTYRFDTRLWSTTFSVKYYFLPEDRLRPYLGVGMEVPDHGTVGPLVATGVDFRLSARWMVNADVSWARVQDRGRHIDPPQFGLGVAYRFGF